MELRITIKNTENIGNLSQSELRQIHEIVEALITTGSLTGIRGGQCSILFDHLGVFQKIEHKYYPYVRRSLDKRV